MLSTGHMAIWQHSDVTQQCIWRIFDVPLSRMLILKLELECNVCLQNKKYCNVIDVLLSYSYISQIWVFGAFKLILNTFDNIINEAYPKWRSKKEKNTIWFSFDCRRDHPDPFIPWGHPEPQPCLVREIIKNLPVRLLGLHLDLELNISFPDRLPALEIKGQGKQGQLTSLDVSVKLINWEGHWLTKVFDLRSALYFICRKSFGLMGDRISLTVTAVIIVWVYHLKIISCSHEMLRNLKGQAWKILQVIYEECHNVVSSLSPCTQAHVTQWCKSPHGKHCLKKQKSAALGHISF